jgi:carbonic anhydrase
MAIEFSRRALFGAACCGALGVAFGRAAVGRAAEIKKTELSPDQALASLKEGNERFIANPAACFEKLAERRREIALGQAPFAAVVAPTRVCHRSCCSAEDWASCS